MIVKSYIKYYNEIKPDYQYQLDLAKKFSEIPQIFSRSVSKLLEKIYGEEKVDKKLFEEYVQFDPDEEPYFKLKKELYEFLGNDWEESDLPSIIEKMAKSAHSRYKQIKDDYDRTETFRLS